MAWKLTQWVAEREAERVSIAAVPRGSVSWAQADIEMLVVLFRAQVSDVDVATYFACDVEDVVAARHQVHRWLTRHRGAAITSRKMLPGDLGFRRVRKEQR